MSRLDLLAVPLSPLHVGEGTEWTPDTFKLEGKELLRFSPQAVAADFAPTQARDFARAVDRGDLKLAQAILQGAVRRQHVRERIALSSALERELGEALRNQHRAGRLHPFVRGSGGPYLPGSAVKGAIRTALLSARVQKELPRFRDWLARQRVQGGRSGQASTELQAQVLGTLDRDPFRFIRVMDAPLPEGRTRIEWIVTRRRDGRRQELQMHFECLRPGLASAFPLVLDVREGLAQAARARDPAKAPEYPIGTKELLRAIDGFFRRRWQRDRERFSLTWCPEPPSQGPDGFPLLLRVGRFSHFESASVEGLRAGWRPQGGRTIEEGSTRAVVQLAGNFASFGWLLLLPRGKEEHLRSLGWLAETPAADEGGRRDASSRRTAAPAAVSGEGRGTGHFAADLTGRRGFVEDEPVEVVRDEGAVLLVRFLDSGDLEEVASEEFRPEE